MKITSMVVKLDTKANSVRLTVSRYPTLKTMFLRKSKCIRETSTKCTQEIHFV